MIDDGDNEKDENRFIVDENMRIIQDKLKHIENMENGDLICIELKHLKEVYGSFLDISLPQPSPLYPADDDKQRITSTKKKDYKTDPVKKYIGLDNAEDAGNIENLENMIQEIDKELFRQRAAVMPYAFNMVYQDGIIFGPFPGDFRRLKKLMTSIFLVMVL